MKKKITFMLAAALAFGCASTVFASDVLEKAYEELAKAEFESTTSGYEVVGGEYRHAEPIPFTFKSGVIGAKTDDFDGDGADELLVFYANHKLDGSDSVYAQMIEEKDGKAVLGGESEKITNFLSGEKGGGCMFVKNVDGKKRIFMQYTGEINSYADGADFRILGVDYDGEGFKTAFAYDGAGSMYTISDEEAGRFKAAGLTGTFDFFEPYEETDGTLGYGFSPYYGDFGGFNIGALETDKDMIVDITVSSNYEDVFDALSFDEWEKQPDMLEKDGVITLSVTDNTNIGTSEQPAVTAPPENGISVYLDGEKMSFDSEPYIEKGTTRVPMRAIFEGLGASVDYEPENKLVTAVKGGTRIELAIGSNIALINGDENELIVPAEIKNSRTMVPLRFVSEALGAKVDWDGETKTITITSDTAAPAENGIAGVYTQNFTEEYDGQSVDIEYSITLNADNTGMISIQDDVPITWTQNKLIEPDGTEFDYTLGNGVLTVDFYGEPSVFTKA